MKKAFLIIGAPSSGKTTDASIIASRHQDCMIHYSTGDMLRDEVDSGSDLSRKIGGYISKGALVPLEIILDTIHTAVKNAPAEAIIIDGYPRSVEQMHALDKILENDDEIDLVAVIEVRVSEEVARERILGRVAEAKEVRSDDSMEVFNDRMEIYTTPLAEIQAFYTQKKLLKVLDGEMTLDIVVSLMEIFMRTRINR